MKELLDLLAFGAHPDDVEVGAGGIIASHVLKGYACGIVDLTAGEMASSGTVYQRKSEAQEAAHILGCSLRECLELPDARLFTDDESICKVAALLRRLRPRIVLAPYFQGDRHPDHNAAGEILRRAAYLSGLKQLSVEGLPFRPQQLYYMILSADLRPDTIVDVSAVYERKEKALGAHLSQFGQDKKEDASTLVNYSSYRRYVRSRDAYFGSLAGVEYGEGLIFEVKPLVKDLVSWSELR